MLYRGGVLGSPSISYPKRIEGLFIQKIVAIVRTTPEPMLASIPAIRPLDPKNPLDITKAVFIRAMNERKGFATKMSLSWAGGFLAETPPAASFSTGSVSPSIGAIIDAKGT
mmetsp:Transcript_26435/g.42690  ORF Transcript_26435/g.42690 Transcript_26435/m.42690 type:complete len:112 (-) Transcript_26435:87-422(-)